MADLEKPSLGMQPPAAQLLPHDSEIKINTPETNDASPSDSEGHDEPGKEKGKAQVKEKEEEKEREGSIKDYFVSSQPSAGYQITWTNITTANLQIRGSP